MKKYRILLCLLFCTQLCACSEILPAEESSGVVMENPLQTISVTTDSETIPETALQFTTTATESETTETNSEPDLSEGGDYNEYAEDDEFSIMFGLVTNQKGSEQDIKREFINKRDQLVAGYTATLQTISADKNVVGSYALFDDADAVARENASSLLIRCLPALKDHNLIETFAIFDLNYNDSLIYSCLNGTPQWQEYEYYNRSKLRNNDENLDFSYLDAIDTSHMESVCRNFVYQTVACFENDTRNANTRRFTSCLNPDDISVYHDPESGKYCCYLVLPAVLERDHGQRIPDVSPRDMLVNYYFDFAKDKTIQSVDVEIYQRPVNEMMLADYKLCDFKSAYISSTSGGETSRPYGCTYYLIDSYYDDVNDVLHAYADRYCDANCLI